MKKFRPHTAQRPWQWIPTLFVSEEISTVVIFYVAGILLVQLRIGYTATTLLSAILLLPWIARSFVRTKVRKMAQFRTWIFVTEFCTFLFAGAAAFATNQASSPVGLVFLCLLLMSSFCAWHSLLSSMYYERMFFPREQRYHLPTKRIASTASLVLTYGSLIMLVGFLQIFYRNIHRAWALGLYLMAGLLLFCLILNLVLLRTPRVFNQPLASSLSETVRHEWSVLHRIVRRPHSVPLLILVFVLLIPQALMFYPRVFFLLASNEMEGLDCSLQDVGFSQGTIGVIAFSVGTVLGRYFMQHSRLQTLLRPLMAVLTLSPLFYFLMALYPQRDNMFALCLMTGAAQFCFGLGLNICLPFVRHFSGERYRNTTSLLTVPLVVTCMALPIALSGLLVEWLGLRYFFCLNALTIPLVWLTLFCFRHQLRWLLPQNKTSNAKQ